MWLDFEGSAGDASWHNWDAWVSCRGGGTGCYRFEQGRVGRALYLDGTGAVSVSPYLTTRVPRVAQTRTGRGAWRSSVARYNSSMPWGNVPDAIVTQRNPRPSVQGERWQPVVRDRIFAGNDYAVSFWVRRGSAMAGRRGILFADSLTPDSNIRIYDDGALLISIVSFGCRTAPISDMPLEEWVFVTAVVRFAKRRALGSCAVYVNGVQRTKSLMAMFLELSKPTYNMSVGHGFVGHIDELKVHNQSLSKGMVGALMQSEGRDGRFVPDTELTVALAVDSANDQHNFVPWMCAVMVPQEDIVRKSKEYGVLLDKVMDTQNDNTERKVERKTAAAVVLIVGILIVSLLAFVTFNGFLTQPFAVFARDITQVSQIDLDAIQEDHSTSLLQEINVMKSAMHVLVANMKTYKSFMPLTMQQTLLNQEEEECDEPEFSSRRSLSSSKQASSSSSKSNSHSHSHSTRMLATKALADSLAKKNMSFLMANVVGFHDGVLVGRETQVIERHSSYVEMLLEVVVLRRGVPETFSGDRMLATFNGARTNTQHRLDVGRAGLQLVNQSETRVGMKLSAGAASGAVRAGHIGTDTMKRYSALGKTVSWVHVLERFAKHNGYGCVVDSSIFEACTTNFVFNHCAFVKSEKAPGVKSTVPSLVSALVEEMEVEETEWMYQLQEAGDKASGVNTAFKHAQEGDWDALAKLVSSLSPDTKDCQAKLLHVSFST